MIGPANIPRFGVHARLITTFGLLSLACAWQLDLRPSDLIPHPGGLEIAREFFAAALTPAWSFESGVPSGARSLMHSVAASLLRTLIFALAAMSLALPAGLGLGLLASEAFWETGPRRPAALARGVRWSVRALIAGARAVHELIWAIVFLAAVGLNSASAVIALALPFAGVLAKVFSEMIDEAPRNAALALQSLGASRAQVVCVGLLPRAASDMGAYAFYRFECAVRSSAVLGFFGFQTLGYDLRLAFENLHYREVWTYLYALMALILGLEAWGAALRRRFVV